MSRSVVIPSFLARDAPSALRTIADQPRRCTLIELRGDLLDRDQIVEIVTRSERDLIVTIRQPDDGGQFAGSELEREQLLLAALTAGCRYIDVEWGRPIARLADGEAASRVLLSHHAEPIGEAELERRLDAMQASGAALLKCVTRFERTTDCESIQRQLSRRQDPRWTMFAAGAAGRWSRLMVPLWGGWGSYAAVDGEPPTAAHQWRVGELIESYRIDEIGPQTGWVALVGSSVSDSSPSPAMHNAGYAALGHDRRYVALDFEEWGEVERFAESSSLVGLGVTMPHKVNAWRRCDVLDPIARRCGAVNTVVIEGDRWHGFNTDGVAVLELLRANGWEPSSPSLLLGAGGSGRAIAAALSEVGADLPVRSRQRPDRWPGGSLDWNPLSPPTPFNVDWLINATPVRDGRLIDHDQTLARRGVVDVVYGSDPTRLVELAHARALRCIDGLQMLVRQAELQFERQVGQPAPGGLFAEQGQRQLRSLG